MEVHHHPKVEKKSLKEYLLEGLMIFIAVSMGFIAENIREHIIVSEKEDVYMHSIHADLQNDAKRLQRLTSWLDRQIAECDSVILLLNKKPTDAEIKKIYTSSRDIIRGLNIDIFITDRTITQLKNSADFKLISNKRVSDSLTDYYKEVEKTSYLQKIASDHKLIAFNRMSAVLRASDYDKVIDRDDVIITPVDRLQLGNYSPTDLNNYLMAVPEVKGISISIQKGIQIIAQKAVTLKELVEKEYGVKE